MGGAAARKRSSTAALFQVFFQLKLPWNFAIVWVPVLGNRMTQRLHPFIGRSIRTSLPTTTPEPGISFPQEGLHPWAAP